MIGKKFMIKYAFRKAKMVKNLKTAVCLLGIMTLSGCYLFRPIDESVDNTPPAPACSSNDGPCITPPESSGEYVNYQEVAADYREYGERTPRDQRIVQAGVASNMAAAIPPTIEEEVTSYEEEIKTTEEEATAEESADTDVNTNIQGSGEDPVRDWLAEEGQSLKSLLTQWSNESGWRLVWKSNRNYTLNAGAMFRGRFADVSAALVRAFGRARPAPIATFYKGNRVLVIETMEDENAY